MNVAFVALKLSLLSILKMQFDFNQKDVQKLSTPLFYRYNANKSAAHGFDFHS